MNDFPGTNNLYQALTVKEVRLETSGVKTFVFDESSTRKISYQAGQYLTLVYHPSGAAIRRSYSITSVPELQELLSITVKRIENGIFSRYLIDDVAPGDVLFSTGAGGLFTLPEEASYQQLFLLAAGSGIAPVYALFKKALHSSPLLPVVLLYSNRSPEETIFRTALEDLVREFPQNLRIEFLYGNLPDLRRARLYRELLLHLWHQYSLVNADQQLFYICGPQSYMRMCTYVLQGEGVPSVNIRREIFNTEGATPVLKQPPDKTPRTVTIYFKGQTFQIESAYPATILQAAKKSGVLLPYSCEVGRCGNCVAKCIKGSVWLSNNEVLTDKEIAEGLVLTCVGYPVNGAVELEIK